MGVPSGPLWAGCGERSRQRAPRARRHTRWIGCTDAAGGVRRVLPLQASAAAICRAFMWAIAAIEIIGLVPDEVGKVAASQT
jgi:hypothetical protein